MPQLPATRSELLAIRARLDLARRGRDLLYDKRDQLLEAVRAIVDLVLAGEDELAAIAARSRDSLAEATAWDGPDVVRTAATGPRSPLLVQTRPAIVMGVRFAELEIAPTGHPLVDRGYALTATSPRIDRAASDFEAQLETLVEFATREIRLRRLMAEIRRTTRRLNALEFAIIPELERQVRAVETTLEERERQERFRVKRGQKTRRRRR